LPPAVGRERAGYGSFNSNRIALSRNHKESAGVIEAKHAYVRDKKEVLTPLMGGLA